VFKEIVDALTAKLEGLSPDKNPAGDEKIISGGKKKPVDVRVVYETAQIRGLEKRRLEAEADLLWNVYFSRQKTREGRAERDRENTAKDAAKKSLAERLKDKKEADRQKAKADKKTDAKAGKKVDKKSVADKATSTVKKSSAKAKKAPQGKVTQDKKGRWRDERGRYAKAPKKDSGGKLDKLLGKVKPGAKGKGKKDGDKGAGDIKGFLKKLFNKVRKRKVKAEALIFWKVYFKLRKKHTKDVKGKTKVSPAKKAGDKAKGAQEKKKAPGKEGGGFWSMLTGFFKIKLLGFFSRLLGKRGLMGLLGKGARLAGRAALWAGRGLMAMSLPVTAVAVATGVAVVQLYRANKARNEAIKAQEEANKAQEDNTALLEKAKLIREARIKAAGAAGDVNMVEQEKLRKQQAKIGEEYDAKVKEIKGGTWDQLDLRGTILEFTGIVGTNEEEQKELDALRDEKIKKMDAIKAEIDQLKKERKLENAKRAASGQELLKEKEDYSRKEDDLADLERMRRKGIGLFASAEEMTAKQLEEGKKKGMDAEETAAAWREQFIAAREVQGLPPIVVEVYGKDAKVKEGTYGGKPAKVEKPKKKDDFVDRPGEPAYSFNSEDTILGFKKGGPLINLIQRQGGEKATRTAQVSKQKSWWENIFPRRPGKKPAPVTGLGNFGKFQVNEIKRSNVYLKQLVELTAKMLQRGPAGQGGSKGVAPAAILPANNSIQGDQGGPTYSDSRSDFHASAYSMHTPGIMA